MESKYLGKSFEGFEVVEYYRVNDYRKSYNGNKIMPHSAYNYILVNHETKDALTLSGNQLRLLNNGVRTIHDMLSCRVGGYRNKQLKFFKQKYLTKTKK